MVPLSMYRHPKKQLFHEKIYHGAVKTTNTSMYANTYDESLLAGPFKSQLLLVVPTNMETEYSCQKW